MPNSNRMLISVSAAMDLLNRICAPMNKVVLRLIASPYKLSKIKPPLEIYCFAYSPHGACLHNHVCRNCRLCREGPHIRTIPHT